MATHFQGIPTIYEALFTDRQQIEELIDLIGPIEVPLLSYLGWAASPDAGLLTPTFNNLPDPCINTTYTWQVRELVPAKVQLDTAYTSGGGTFALKTDHAKRVRVGNILFSESSYRWYTITAVDIENDTVDVTPNDDADANISDEMELKIIFNARGENADYFDDTITSDGDQFENYTQIFHDTVFVGGTEESVEKVGVSDIFADRLMMRMKQLAQQFELAVMYGRRNDTKPSNNATARRMGGMYYWGVTSTANGGNTLAHSGSGTEEFTESVLLDVLENAYNAGVNFDCIMMPYVQKKKMDTWYNSILRGDMHDTLRGILVNQYEWENGVLDVVLNRQMNKRDIVLFRKQDITIGPLQGNGNSRAFFSEPIPKVGDRHGIAITGEYTMRVANPNNSIAWIYNMAT